MIGFKKVSALLSTSQLIRCLTHASYAPLWLSLFVIFAGKLVEGLTTPSAVPEQYVSTVTECSVPDSTDTFWETAEANTASYSNGVQWLPDYALDVANAPLTLVANNSATAAIQTVPTVQSMVIPEHIKSLPKPKTALTSSVVEHLPTTKTGMRTLVKPQAIAVEAVTEPTNTLTLAVSSNGELGLTQKIRQWLRARSAAAWPLFGMLFSLWMVIAPGVKLRKFLRKVPKSKNMDTFELLECKKEHDVSIAYLLTYIIPLTAFDFMSFTGVFNFFIFYCLIVTVSIRRKLVYFNMWLEFEHWNVYRVSLQVAEGSRKLNEVLLFSQRDLNQLTSRWINLRELSSQGYLDPLPALSVSDYADPFKVDPDELAEVSENARAESETAKDGLKPG